MRTYALNLIQASPSTNQPRIFASGTMAIGPTGSAPPVGGTIELPGTFTSSIAFQGTTSETAAGTLFIGSGGSDEVQIGLTLVSHEDTFLFAGSYLGGLLSLLDARDQGQTFLFAMEGIAPD